MRIEIKLKKIAEDRGYNLNYIIRHSGASVGSIRHYWHNKAQRVDFGVLERLCALLDVEPGELIGFKADSGSQP